MSNAKYNKEYNENNYSPQKVYIQKDELPTIKEHMKSKGYKSFSGYVKDLIEKDMQGTSGINVNTNKGIVANNIHGDISIK